LFCSDALLKTTVGRLTPDWRGRGRGWSLWAICGKKAEFFTRKICHSLSDWDICYLGVCFWNSISE